MSGAEVSAGAAGGGALCPKSLIVGVAVSGVEEGGELEPSAVDRGCGLPDLENAGVRAPGEKRPARVVGLPAPPAALVYQRNSGPLSRTAGAGRIVAEPLTRVANALYSGQARVRGHPAARTISPPDFHAK